MRWSWETEALLDGPLGSPPFAVDSRKVVRTDGVSPGPPATPASRWGGGLVAVGGPIG